MEKATEMKADKADRFLRISYVGSVKEGPVFDTTYAEEAKKAKIFDQKRVYKALPVILGHHQIITGLEEAITGLKVGEEKEVEIPPAKAYGERSPDLIRLIPVSAFKKQGLNPVPGMKLDLDGRPARIQTVTGGRVRVDFNNELAGKTLIYKVKVESEAKKIEERIEYLVERSFNTADDFTVKISGTNIDIFLPELAMRDKNILIRKASLVSEIYQFTNLESVTFIESWKKNIGKKEPKEAAKK